MHSPRLVDFGDVSRFVSCPGKVTRGRENRRAFLRLASGLAGGAVLGFGRAVRAAPGEPLQIQRRKQLFVDDYLIAESHGLARELGTVVKANEGRPIFTDGWFYGTVLHDEEKFKLWYRKPGTMGYGYAESTDGMQFQTLADVQGINFAGDYNLAVEIDGHAPSPDQRFLGGYDAPGMAAGVATSGDGIHWTPLNAGKPVTFRAADCHNQVLWDELAQTYRLFTRTDFGNGGGPLAATVAKDFEVRGTRGMTNPDLHAHPAAWEIVRQWYLNRDGEREYLRRQIYSMTCWIHQGIYFALLSVYDYPADVSEGRVTDHHLRHERDVLNFYIATSRDADSWNLEWVYAGQPIIPRGPDDAFDKDIVFPSSTIVTHADQHWLYYGGANERHGTEELKPAVRFDRQAAIGLARLRLDGFIHLHAAQEGSLLTQAFVLVGDQLAFNVDASRGEFRVEILDEEGRPLAGFSGADAARGTHVDDVRWRPRWREQTGLASLRGRPIRLKLALTQCRLYALQVVDASSG